MKRIILVNAHCNHLLMNTWWYYTFGVKAPSKYQILFRKLLEREDVEVVNLLTPMGCCYPKTSRSMKPMWRVWTEMLPELLGSEQTVFKRPSTKIIAQFYTAKAVCLFIFNRFQKHIKQFHVS